MSSKATVYYCARQDDAELKLVAKLITDLVMREIILELGTGRVEISFKSSERRSVALASQITFDQPYTPKTIKVLDLIAAKLPGLWGYANLEKGIKNQKVCTICHKDVNV